MPTKRTRRARTRRGVPEELRPLFSIGMGWSHQDQEWLAEQWREYGPAFLESWPHDRPPFALAALGDPSN